MPLLNQQVLDSLDGYNEAEVRFHIIDPLMRKLGFGEDPEVYLKLEERLEYPYHHIGRRAPKKDLPLGFPDYRAGLKGRKGSFIVEAKAASIDLSQLDVEQAHSFAAHAQVCANYFLLCNGRKLKVFETLRSPDESPLIDIDIRELDDRFHEIYNVLSPDGLRKNCIIDHDLGLPLGVGLGSAAAIVDGHYEIASWAIRISIDGTDQTDALKASVPQLAQMDEQMDLLANHLQLRIGKGRAWRDEDGRIHASMHFVGATKNSLQAMKLLGIDEMTFSTDAETISNDRESPTIFETNAEFSVEKGAKILPLIGSEVTAELGMQGDVFVAAGIHLEGLTLRGDYTAQSEHRSQIPGLGEMKVDLEYIGSFFIECQS